MEVDAEPAHRAGQPGNDAGRVLREAGPPETSAVDGGRVEMPALPEREQRPGQLRSERGSRGRGAAAAPACGRRGCPASTTRTRPDAAATRIAGSENATPSRATSDPGAEEPRAADGAGPARSPTRTHHGQQRVRAVGLQLVGVLHEPRGEGDDRDRQPGVGLRQQLPSEDRRREQQQEPGGEGRQPQGVLARPEELDGGLLRPEPPDRRRLVELQRPGQPAQARSTRLSAIESSSSHSAGRRRKASSRSPVPDQDGDAR